MLDPTHTVGDMTIGYDPPRRGRVISMAVHLNRAHEYVEDGGSGSRLVKGPKPEGGLRPVSVNRDVYVTCIVRHVR